MPLIIGAVIVVGAVAAGVQFRQGRSRQWLMNYRNPALPAIYRNLPIVGPLTPIAGLPILLMAAPGLLGIDVQLSVSHRIAGIGLFGALVVLFGLGGATVLWSVRPPRWLIPRWLREEDRELGFVAPPMDWFDWATLVFGVGMLSLGAWATIEVVVLLFSSS